ncbi:MAG TPA: hypothetical protein VK458_03860 [Myxococcaceae bacterium]|nr:hypothetical protein [Myxococcaceae bacterium]
MSAHALRVGGARLLGRGHGEVALGGVRRVFRGELLEDEVVGGRRSYEHGPTPTVDSTPVVP